MYNPDFLNGETALKLDRIQGNRTCWTCGHKIKKTTVAFYNSARPRGFIMCMDCMAEAYFRGTTHHFDDIKSLQEQQKLLQEAKTQKEVDLHFQDRINLLLKDYEAEKIIKEVLKRVKRKS